MVGDIRYECGVEGVGPVLMGGSLGVLGADESSDDNGKGGVDDEEEDDEDDDTDDREKLDRVVASLGCARDSSCIVVRSCTGGGSIFML
jgi:hypothetical protein